jgi:CHRD domain
MVAVLLAPISPTQAHQFRFSAPLTGADESTSNNSTGMGTALVTLDEDENTMRVQVSFNDLIGAVTSANLFAVTGERLAGTGIAVISDASTEPPTASLPDFPVGDSAGEYDRTINLQLESSYDPGFVATYGGSNPNTQVGTALAYFETQGLGVGRAYLSISTTAYPDGEIRGFPVYVPGDFNNNGVVDAADYIVWRHTLGQTGEGLDADYDNSNSIDGQDFVAWQQHFGQIRFNAMPGIGRGAAVPEPGTMSLILACGIALSVRRRRPR